MRIEGNRFNLFENEKNKAKKIETEIEKNQPGEKEDVYDFNTSYEELKEMFDAVHQHDDVRYDKIEEVKRKEQNGEYRVTGKDVVLKVLEEKLRDSNYN